MCCKILWVCIALDNMLLCCQILWTAAVAATMRRLRCLLHGDERPTTKLSTVQRPAAVGQRHSFKGWSRQQLLQVVFLTVLSVHPLKLNISQTCQKTVLSTVMYNCSIYFSMFYQSSFWAVIVPINFCLVSC